MQFADISPPASHQSRSADDPELARLLWLAGRAKHANGRAFRKLFPIGRATLFLIGFAEYGRRTDRFEVFTRRVQRRLDKASEARLPVRDREEYLPFNPHLYGEDANGHAYRHITSPYDEMYLMPPAGWVPDGMLPPEELEIRHLLLTLAIMRRNIAADKNRNEEGAARALRAVQSELTRAANRTWAHKCALRRIASVLANGGREQSELLACLR
ncbi:TPA: hypothetical protein ACYLN4_006606 [Burkholderia lata]